MRLQRDGVVIILNRIIIQGYSEAKKYVVAVELRCWPGRVCYHGNKKTYKRTERDHCKESFRRSFTFLLIVFCQPDQHHNKPNQEQAITNDSKIVEKLEMLTMGVEYFAFTNLIYILIRSAPA